MISRDNDIEKFCGLVDALRPWLGRIVFVGGWAHRLYRERPESAQLPYAPLRTTDADVVLDPRTIGRSENVRVRLIAHGFTEELSGDDRPPVAHYVLGAADAGFYAEFLTPLPGSERRRDGTPDVTVRVGGVVAQKLRDLDVLLIAPWNVPVGEANGFPLQEAAIVQIPNPVSFIVQKLLIHTRRKREERAKDVLYIHDTIELFGGALADLHEVWGASVAPALHRSARERATKRVGGLFHSINDTIREASMIAAHREVTPGMIQELCEAGLAELLG
jgi:hypothetical protein